MPIYTNGEQGCKIYFEGEEICVGYLNGEKVFGCRANSTVSDNSANLSSKDYTFKTGDFTLNYTTDAPHTYDKVYIDSLPAVDKLNLLGNPTSKGDNFKVLNSSGLKFNLSDNYASYGGVLYDFGESIDGIVARYEGLGYKLTENSNGDLTFSKQDDPTDTVIVTGTEVNNSKLCFNFKVADNSTQKLLTNVAEFCLIPQGDINVKGVYVNTPPTVGDNSITMKRGDIRTFTRADFIDDTDPRFSDKEGDQPYKLRVDVLPTSGTLTLRGTPVTQGQELDFINDIDTGDFKYTPDVNQTVPGVSFKFSVSDTGSKQFG
jgi:hypothetical protein